MLRWNSGFLASAVLGFAVWFIPFCSTGLAQSNVQSGEGYYSRPDLRRALPERLVPPGRLASPVPAAPISRNSAWTGQQFGGPQNPAQSDPSQNFQDTKKFALPPIVQAADIGRQAHNASAPLMRANSQSMANQQVPRYEQRLIETAQIPAHDSNHDSQVTRATILMTQQGGDPFGQVPRRESRTNNSGPRSDDPFADPPVDDVSPQERENPFADPPQNQLPQNRQNPFTDPPPDKLPQNRDNPFDDPPPDMDPNQTRNPFGPPDRLPGERPDVDPFADSPQNIDPARSFPGSEPEGPDDPEILIDPGPGPDDGAAKPPRIKLGPFKARGFEPKPLLPAPPSREYPQYPGAASSRQADSIGIDPNFPYAIGGDPYLNQPTLVDSANYGFQKSHLYEGIPQSYQEQNFATYHCADCGFDSRLPGNRLIDRFRCRSCDGFRPTAFNSRAPQFADWNQCSPQENCPNGYFVDDYWQDDCGVGCSDCCFDDSCCGVAPMFYMAVLGGYTGLEDSFVGNVLTGGAGPLQIEFNDGFGTGAALGQIQGQNLRTEIEFMFRDSQPDQIQTLGQAAVLPIELSGSVKSYSGMLNFVWDFQRRPLLCGIQPYAGGGVGFAIVDADLLSSGGTLFSGKDSAFAWQLFAGMNRALTHRVDGFAEYRYFKADDIRDNSGRTFEYETNNILFGLRMHF